MLLSNTSILLATRNTRLSFGCWSNGAIIDQFGSGEISNYRTASRRPLHVRIRSLSDPQLIVHIQRIGTVVANKSKRFLGAYSMATHLVVSCP
jgi:hypothetical protein